MSEEIDAVVKRAGGAGASGAGADCEHPDVFAGGLFMTQLTVR